tara:strand:- start:828 stop:1517 length:690 start_codon:yes stop_codon:yes gene_type:complete
MIENQPLISVLMSVKDDEKNVGAAIESILNQTYRNLEFLINDDSSTDSSLKVIRKYEKIDTRIKVFTNKTNIGLTKSLNKLINESKGKFIARQDSDDVSLSERLINQMEALNKFDLGAVTSRALVKKTKKLIPNFSYYLPVKIVMKFKNPFIHGTLLIKKDILENVKNYDENFIYAQDYKLMNDILEKKVRVKILKEPLYILNTEDNISSNFFFEQKFYSDCVKKGINP